MRNNQVRIVLIVLVIVAIVGLLGKIFLNLNQSTEIILNSANLNSNSVDKIILSDREDQATVYLNADDNRWYVGSYPVLDEYMNALWNTVSEINRAELVSNNPENHQYMGVDPRNTTNVEFYYKDELIETFLIGDKEYAPIEEDEVARMPWSQYVLRCYLRKANEVSVYGIFCPYPSLFAADPTRWPDPYIAKIQPADVETLVYNFYGQEFLVKKIDARWYIDYQGQQSEAKQDVMYYLLESLTTLITSDYPEFWDKKIVGSLDWNDPDITLRVNTKQVSNSKSIYLSFIERPDEDFSYYVKDATKTYVHFLSSRKAPDIIKSRADLVYESPK